MESKFTLHCFAGDSQSLAILLLSQYLKAPLNVRYLKPINIMEKIYKSTLTKTFPMLQIEEGEKSTFVERSMTILRHIARRFDSGKLYNEKSAYSASVIDALLDSVYQEILPAAFTLHTAALGIIELDKSELAEIRKDLQALLKGLDRAIANLPKEVTLADFPLFTLWLMLKQEPQISKSLSSLKNYEQRIKTLGEDESFGALAKPHLLRA